MLVSKITKKRIHDYLAEGKRFDSRGLLDYRELSIECGISKNAEGSARVQLGKTEVLAGVKLNIAEPYPDSEDAGTLSVITELLPLASSKFEPGPPSIEAVEIARIVDRGIRESGFIDFKKLCIKEGEKVWSVSLDIYPLNYDGNLLDAAAIAAVAALKEAKMPKYDEKTGRVKYGELTNKKLPLTENMPFTMTFHKIGDHIILDPVTEEEESSDARLSIAYSKSGINAMQKGNFMPFEVEEVSEIFDIAEKKWKLIGKKVEEAAEKSVKE